ncbi:hypothetical protein Tco_1444313 [Tanacetum coccineum]
MSRTLDLSGENLNSSQFTTGLEADILKVVLSPRKRLCLALGPRFEVGEGSFAARPTRGYRADYGFIRTLYAELRRDRVREMGYGITNVLEDPAEATNEVPPTTIAELSQRVTDLVTTVREMRYHLNTAMLVESEARVFQEAWVQSMGYSRAVHDETQLIAALGCIDTLEVRDPAHTDDLEDANSCS